MAEREPIRRGAVNEWLDNQHPLFIAALAKSKLEEIIKHVHGPRIQRVPGAGADPAWKEIAVVGVRWQVQISLDGRLMRHRPLCEPSWVCEDEPWIDGAPDDYFRTLLRPEPNNG